MKKAIAILLTVITVCSLLPVYALAEGEPSFSGMVTGVYNGTIYITNSYGSVLQFALGAGVPQPQYGDNVTVYYNGDIMARPTAVRLDIQSASVYKTVTGTAERVYDNELYITSNGQMLHFYLLETTVIGGIANKAAAGDTVTVTYSETQQYLSVICLATKIDVTAHAKAASKDTVTVVISDDKEKKEEKEDPVNKTLTGEVTKLSNSKITIRTSKGKTWSVRISSRTKEEGKYDLEVGATVKILYDGYASNVPEAKKITIKKAKPEPERKTGTRKGYVDFFGGMAIGLDSGFVADVAYAKHTGSAPREPGSFVTITYYTENGQNYATKINWEWN